MKTGNEFLKILEKFPEVAVLVVGDIMLDRYWWGSVERISPEAPVPVVRVNKMSLAAGGAANVAANIAGLGAKVSLAAAIGDDADGGVMPEVLSEAGLSAEHLVRIKGRPTTLKTRVIAHNQHVVRIDQEITDNLTPSEEEAVWKKIEEAFKKSDVIVLSDYAKGFLSDNLIMRLITSAEKYHKTIMIDPKGKDYTKYRGASIITPNKKEAADASGLEESDSQIVEKAGDKLLSELNLESVLITQGEDGMTLFERGHSPKHFDSQARHVYDVTGAGDTVIAALAVAVGAGADLRTAAKIANTAAGFAVEEVGTTVIGRKQLEDYFGHSAGNIS